MNLLLIMLYIIKYQFIMLYLCIRKLTPNNNMKRQNHFNHNHDKKTGFHSIFYLLNGRMFY